MKQATLSTAVAVVAFAAAAALPLAQAQTLNVGRKVNRDELRECLDAGDSIKARSEDLKARSAKLQTMNEELKAEGESLTQDTERLEKSSSMLGMGRDRLERRKTAYDKKVATAKSESEKFTPEAETLNKDLDAYNQRCGGITYSREDREAIQKEREAGKK
jgi:chromosome segregation ATPase